MIGRTQHMPARASGNDLSPEFVLRGDRPFRFERGGKVFATDGRIGTLKQVIVDESAGVVLSLVVEVDKSNVSILVPPEAIGKTGGSAVFLTDTRNQFLEWMTHAPRHQPQLVTKANIKKLIRNRTRSGTDPRRTILQAGTSFVETGIVAMGEPGR